MKYIFYLILLAIITLNSFSLNNVRLPINDCYSDSIKLNTGGNDFRDTIVMVRNYIDNNDDNYVEGENNNNDDNNDDGNLENDDVDDDGARAAVSDSGEETNHSDSEVMPSVLGTSLKHQAAYELMFSSFLPMEHEMFGGVVSRKRVQEE